MSSTLAITLISYLISILLSLMSINKQSGAEFSTSELVIMIGSCLFNFWLRRCLFERGVYLRRVLIWEGCYLRGAQLRRVLQYLRGVLIWKGCLFERGVYFRRMLIWEECLDRKSTRLNSSHANISYAVFCLKKKKK